MMWARLVKQPDGALKRFAGRAAEASYQMRFVLLKRRNLGGGNAVLSQISFGRLILTMANEMTGIEERPVEIRNDGFDLIHSGYGARVA
jgi:hypothetical protein